MPTAIIPAAIRSQHIAGNKYRLFTEIYYEDQTILLRQF